jgi:hypothetical protein
MSTPPRMSEERLEYLEGANGRGIIGIYDEVFIECRRARASEDYWRDSFESARGRLVTLEVDASLADSRLAAAERERAELVKLLKEARGGLQDELNQLSPQEIKGQPFYKKHQRTVAKIDRLLARLLQPPQQATGKEGA